MIKFATKGLRPLQPLEKIMENILYLSTMADELVSIDADIKKLAQRKRQIHAEFKARGKDVNIIGNKATIEVRTHKRTMVDNKEIHKHVSRQLLRAHTTKKDVTVVNIKPVAASVDRSLLLAAKSA